MILALKHKKGYSIPAATWSDLNPLDHWEVQVAFKTTSDFCHKMYSSQKNLQHRFNFSGEKDNLILKKTLIDIWDRCFSNELTSAACCFSDKKTDLCLWRPPSVIGLIMGAPSWKKIVLVWVGVVRGVIVLGALSPSRVSFGQSLNLQAPGVWAQAAKSCEGSCTTGQSRPIYDALCISAFCSCCLKYQRETTMLFKAIYFPEKKSLLGPQHWTFYILCL